MRSASMLALGALIAAGCGAGASVPADGTMLPTAAQAASTDEICPADLPGLRARSSNLRGGSALVLTADREHVYELRHRIRRFAEEHRHAAGERARDALSRGEQPVEETAVDASTVRVVEIPRGARLEVRPLDPVDVRALRDELRSGARDLSAGLCPLALTMGR